MLVYLGLILLYATLAAGWLLTLLSMPGNWLMIAAVALYAYLVPDGRLDIGWPTVVALIGLAVLAELLEFAAGALGAARAGGSKRAALLGALGSMIGAVFGAATGVPVPVVGSMVGAVLFACLGALLGAMLGEAWKGRDFDQSLRVGQAAFWGRLLGTLAKITMASAIAGIAAIAPLVA